MNDLVQFLNDRLAEDEAAARGVLANAEGRPLEQGRYEQWVGVNETILGDQAGHVVAYGVAWYALPHIARHDPARTLREVAAKRAILELDICMACDVEGQPCDHRNYTLEYLAEAYSDHEEYREEWRP